MDCLKICNGTACLLRSYFLTFNIYPGLAGQNAEFQTRRSWVKILFQGKLSTCGTAGMQFLCRTLNSKKIGQKASMTVCWVRCFHNLFKWQHRLNFFYQFATTCNLLLIPSLSTFLRWATTSLMYTSPSSSSSICLNISWKLARWYFKPL